MSLTLDQYQVLALRTEPKRAVLDRLTNASLGIAGESGEIADHIKKYLYHGHDLDGSFLEKEIGDVLWYLAVMSDAIGLTLSEVAQMNVNKLNARYPEGFSEERSKNRDG